LIVNRTYRRKPSPAYIAFAMGYAFTMIPMLKTMSLKQAARVTIIGDTDYYLNSELENSYIQR
jgi:hypothetical protein